MKIEGYSGTDPSTSIRLPPGYYHIVIEGDFGVAGNVAVDVKLGAEWVALRDLQDATVNATGARAFNALVGACDVRLNASVTVTDIDLICSQIPVSSV